MFQIDQYILCEEMVKYREWGQHWPWFISSCPYISSSSMAAHSSTQKMKAASPFQVLVLSMRLCDVRCQKTVF
jgi:hypothetical protein